MLILSFSISFACFVVILFILCVIPQQQLTLSPVKSRKMPVFQGVAPWHTNFTFFCFISLWDSAPVHSPSDKEHKSSSQDDAHFSGHCNLVSWFYFTHCHLSLRLSTSSLTLWQGAQPLLSGRCPFFRALNLGISI